MVISKLVGAKRRLRRLEARLFNARHAPELATAYEAFARHTQISSNRQPLKGRDLWGLLERFSPGNIVELGSGTTSAIFALWTRRNGSRYRAFEHHSGWAAVTEDCLETAGLANGAAAVTVVPTRVAPGGEAIGFAEAVPRECDFLYVDGPPCRLADGRKVPNDDVVRLLETGGRPTAIVIDGRFETVDLIRKHPAAREYDFRPSFEYCIGRGLWSRALGGREHTVFSRSTKENR